MEIYDLFIEDTPLRHCPHASGFRAFVLSFLSSRANAFAAQKIREAFVADKDSATETQMILVLHTSGTRRTWSIVIVFSLENEVVSSFTF